MRMLFLASPALHSQSASMREADFARGRAGERQAKGLAGQLSIKRKSARLAPAVYDAHTRAR